MANSLAGMVTLLFGAKDEEHNRAVDLKDNVESLLSTMMPEPQQTRAFEELKGVTGARGERPGTRLCES